MAAMAFHTNQVREQLLLFISLDKMFCCACVCFTSVSQAVFTWNTGARPTDFFESGGPIFLK